VRSCIAIIREYYFSGVVETNRPDSWRKRRRGRVRRRHALRFCGPLVVAADAFFEARFCGAGALAREG